MIIVKFILTINLFRYRYILLIVLTHCYTLKKICTINKTKENYFFMTFEPLGKTIKSLLSDHRTFNIPRFQRDYSWDKTNYREFLTDIINQLKHNQGVFETDKYFLGTMILLGNKNSELIDVIDGQQRLTTITIFLAAIRNHLLRTKNPRAIDIADTIQNDYIVKKIDGEIHRRLEPKTSFPYFANKIQDYDYDKSDDIPTSDEESEIKSTFDFFQEQLSFENINKLFSKMFSITLNDESYIDSLKAIRNQLVECEIVSIYADDKLQANEIFESINSKGKPLTQIDLIKNYIFNAISESAVGVDNLQLEWTKMKKQISSNSTDSNFSISFDDFVLDYLKAKFSSMKVNKINTYEKFRKKFPNKAEISNFVKNIADDIDLYLKVINPSEADFSRKEKKPIYTALQAINRFKGRQVRIPILSLFLKQKQKKSIIRNSDMIDFLQFLANFHFAVFGLNMKFRANQVSKPFSDFSIAINNAKDKLDVATAISDLKESLVMLIDKDTFIEMFTKLTFNKKSARDGYTQFPTSYALNTLEDKLSNISVHHSDSTIEHIFDESESNNLNIGNLTVLEQNINNDINQQKQKAQKMLSYSEKKKYYQYSQYKMVINLVNDYDAFDSTVVEKRAKELAVSFYEKVLKS